MLAINALFVLTLFSSTQLIGAAPIQPVNNSGKQAAVDAYLAAIGSHTQIAADAVPLDKDVVRIDRTNQSGALHLPEQIKSAQELRAKLQSGLKGSKPETPVYTLFKNGTVLADYVISSGLSDKPVTKPVTKTHVLSYFDFKQDKISKIETFTKTSVVKVPAVPKLEGPAKPFHKVPQPAPPKYIIPVLTTRSEDAEVPATEDTKGELTKFKLPTPKLTKSDLLKFGKPDAPKISIPEFGQPETPKASLSELAKPDIHKFGKPDAPRTGFPELTKPDFTRFGKPDVPKVAIPELTKLGLSKFEKKLSPKHGTHKFELPKFKLPGSGDKKIKLTKLKLPKVTSELPEAPAHEPRTFGSGLSGGGLGGGAGGLGQGLPQFGQGLPQLGEGQGLSSSFGQGFGQGQGLSKFGQGGRLSRFGKGGPAPDFSKLTSKLGGKGGEAPDFSKLASQFGGKIGQAPEVPKRVEKWGKNGGYPGHGKGEGLPKVQSPKSDDDKDASEVKKPVKDVVQSEKSSKLKAPKEEEPETEAPKEEESHESEAAQELEA